MIESVGNNYSDAIKIILTPVVLNVFSMTYDVLDQIDNDEVDAATAADDNDDDYDEDVRGLVRVRSVMMIRTRGIDPTFLKVTPLNTGAC